MKLAELVLVLVPGSVESERMSSALKYPKSPRHSSLKEKHTNVAGCKKKAQTIGENKNVGKVQCAWWACQSGPWNNHLLLALCSSRVAALLLLGASPSMQDA
eukprot:390701-Pelagomonas_calceolata.AAC.1